MANWNNQFTVEEDERAQLMSQLNDEMIEAEEIAVLVSQYVMPYVCKEPCRTNKQKGAEFVQYILKGHSKRCHEMFRVEKRIFHMLCSKLVEHGLKDSDNIGVQEMVAIFLHMVGHGHCNRVLQEIFQHSGETISRHLHRVLKACFNLARENIKPLDPMFRSCHPKIKDDRRYFPYFDNAIGAIDGTHVPCVVSQSVRDKYIGRKGYPTQNVMAVCDWDMCFTFVLAGWEGTTHDARVFHSAISTPSMNFPHPPEGKYYLVDAGYPTPMGYLGPYRSERYHLPEFRRQPRFENHNETFNFYHSSLRCTIERTFGVWKNRFEILRTMRKYKYQTQVQLVCATMAIHNFIRRNSQSDIEFRQAENGSTIDGDNSHQVGEGSTSNFTASSSSRMNSLRDRIRDQIVRDL